MIKVIIAGSREFSDYELLKDTLKRFFKGKRPSELGIVSGGARGTDKLGERFAKEFGIKLTVFKAEWDKYGKRAGYLRNAEMADYGDELIAFWDGVSKSTLHMIHIAEDRGLKVKVIEV